MKVLVLSGRFGMGHEMAANAICEQFRKIDEQAEIEKKDPPGRVISTYQ